jgi:hypothetical protein
MCAGSTYGPLFIVIGIEMVLFLHTRPPSRQYNRNRPPNQGEPVTTNTTDLKLDWPEPEGKPRISLRICLPDRAVIAAKSLRRAQSAIRDTSADNIVLLLQRRLAAGDLVAKPASARRRRRTESSFTPPETTMGRFQQGVAQ